MQQITLLISCDDCPDPKPILLEITADAKLLQIAGDLLVNLCALQHSPAHITPARLRTNVTPTLHRTAPHPPQKIIVR